MEKRAIIEPGRTPPEHPKKQPDKEKTAGDVIAALDADFRKRAAETVVKNTQNR